MRDSPTVTTHSLMSRADFLRKGAIGATIGTAAAFGLPMLARADGSTSSPESVQVAEIYQLQAAFHRAKSHQDIELMASLWAPDATFIVAGPSGSVLYSGRDAIRAFFLTTGSFKHHRMSLVPSYKDQINVDGNQAFLYFECHDIALDSNDPGGPVGALVTHLNNYGTVRKVNGSWLFFRMQGGSIPLSVDTVFDS